MTETTETHPAAGFNVEAWLQDAQLPEQSADVFKRADVGGQLSALKRQIELHRKAAAITAERTAGDTNELNELEKQYAHLAETFAASMITVYTRALSPGEKRDMRASHEKRVKDLDPQQQNEEYGYDLLAASIVAVQPFEGERTPVSWTPEQVRAMENAIGSAQMSQVLKAHQIAQNALPVVDADFLRKPSGEGDGAQ